MIKIFSNIEICININLKTHAELNCKLHVDKIHKEDFEKLEKPITCEDLKFDCDRCDLKFISAKILEYHIEFGHIRNGHEKECKLCFKKFTKRTYLINHQHTVHKNETEFLHRNLTASDLKYSCNLCDKKFDR